MMSACPACLWVSAIMWIKIWCSVTSLRSSGHHCTWPIASSASVSIVASECAHARWHSPTICSRDSSAVAHMSALGSAPSATGQLGEGVSCSVETGRAIAIAGLHPATGGDGTLLCSGDMLLEALVACAGVTLRAVATALGLEVRGGTVRAEGDLDFRGTLAVDK